MNESARPRALQNLPRNDSVHRRVTGKATKCNFLKNGSPWGFIAGVLELFGGGLLILGLFTRGTALLLAIEMGLVLGRVKFPAVGIYEFGEYELPLLLGAMALALTTTGAGAISIDAFTFESARKSPKKSKRKE
jgi:uncharacterized membrane protein YphA (DoxX/SURF4 family)